jgi:hypothetical protein
MALVKQGTTMYLVLRAGDFTTIAPDPAAPWFMYFSGQVGFDPYDWRTWIMQVGRTCTADPRRCA